MPLLEREPVLAELEALLRDAAGGAGRVAAVCGEAGAGKTTLVDHFSAQHATTVRTLRGLCDPLSTPRPLGPVYDMAAQTTGPLASAMRDGAGREGLFSAFLAELGPDHQLHHLLGELPRDAVRRLKLPLLSEDAVRTLARESGRATEGVWA